MVIWIKMFRCAFWQEMQSFKKRSTTQRDLYECSLRLKYTSKVYSVFCKDLDSKSFQTVKPFRWSVSWVIPAVCTGTEPTCISTLSVHRKQETLLLVILCSLVEITIRHIIISLKTDHCKLLACWILLSVEQSTDHYRCVCPTVLFCF